MIIVLMPARWVSIVTSALVLLGLVGMHHLVVAACHHGASHTAHGSVLSMESVVAHSTHASSDAVPVEAPGDGSQGAPGGVVGAAATCLAILLMLVGLVLPHMLARVRRWHMSRVTILEQWVSTSPVRPPDLNLLSVSRT